VFAGYFLNMKNVRRQLLNTVNYAGYQAKEASRSKGGMRSLARRALNFLKVGILYNIILYPYGRWRHRALLRQANRSQAHTYTCFYRSPLQLEALAGPVIQYLTAGGRKLDKLRILVFACSNGAEAYTLAAVLMKVCPQMDFHIEASDLHEEMVNKARNGIYLRDEVLCSEYASEEFVADLFDRSGENFIVKPEIRSKVSFSCVNLVSSRLSQRFEPADIVFAQNVLFHLDPAAARAAFVNIVGLLKERAALFVEGMDLDLKIALTQEFRLKPISYKCRQIYEQSRTHISLAWWNYYYGAEPYSIMRSDPMRRYGSIFMK